MNDNSNSNNYTNEALPVGPYDTEEQIIEAVRVWASKSEPNGGGFEIFKESRKPAVKTKGPRRLLMCDKSGKVKQHKSNQPNIQHSKKCDCVWGVWIEQCKEGWTTVELIKKARERLSQPGATMATVHNHTLMQTQSVAEVDIHARNDCTSVPPPNSKQWLSSVPTLLTAATPSWVPFPPLSCHQLVPFPPTCAPPSHQQLPPFFNVARNNNTSFAHNNHFGVRNNYHASVPPTKKQRTSSRPLLLSAATPFRVPYQPLYLPPSHQQLPPYFNVAPNNMPFVENNLMEVFGFTLFGIYCRVCKGGGVHVGPSEHMIFLHLQSKHHGVCTREAARAFKAVADKEVQKLSRHANSELYLLGDNSDEFACRCEAILKEPRSTLQGRQFLPLRCS